MGVASVPSIFVGRRWLKGRDFAGVVRIGEGPTLSRAGNPDDHLSARLKSGPSQFEKVHARSGMQF